MCNLRRVAICALALAFASLAVPAMAKNCKPNFKGKDRITKLQFAEWSQILYKTGFLSGVLKSTSEINITGTVVREGADTYKVNIILEKQESNPARAAIESPYKPEKGKEFLFGFKEGGQPLTFVADSVRDDTRVDTFGNINTKVILTAHVKAADIAAIKDALANRQIDAVRVTLANNLVIEQTVNQENGEAFMAKIQCWLSFEPTP